jgi:hypoxanthine phosphoribosyltransferase
MTFQDQEFLDRDPRIARVLIGSVDLQRRVTELGREVSAEYTSEDPPILVSILKGGVVFLADLIRSMTVAHEIDFMAVSSYTGQNTTGVVKINMDLQASITDRHVLIVEDIVDTGLTLTHLLELLSARKPKSVRVCALLNKVDARRKEVRIDHTGFDIPDEFVIGYGLDYNEHYRNLPFIGVLRG